MEYCRICLNETQTSIRDSLSTVSETETETITETSIKNKSELPIQQMKDLFRKESTRNPQVDSRIELLERKMNLLLTLIQDLQRQPELDLETYENDVEEEIESIQTDNTTNNVESKVDEEIKTINYRIEPFTKEVQRHKKPLIKQKILSELTKEQRSASLLKKLIVDELQFCSKASFYRYIDELRKEGQLEKIHINNREYLIKIEEKREIN